MFRVVRAKVASTVAEISIAEDYSWHKWLKIPENEKIFFPQPSCVRVLPPVPLNELIPPAQRDYLFSFTLSKLISKSRGIVFKEPTTNLFSYKFQRQLPHIYNFGFRDSLNKISDKSIYLKFLTITQHFADIKIKVNLGENWWSDFSIPEVFDKLNTLNANIIQIALLSANENQFSKKIYRLKFILNKKNQKYYTFNSLIMNPADSIKIIPFRIPYSVGTSNFSSVITTSVLAGYELNKINSPVVLASDLLPFTTISLTDDILQMSKNILQPPIINDAIQTDYTVQDDIKSEFINEPEVQIKNFSRELLYGKYLSDKYKHTAEWLSKQKEKYELNSILIICGSIEYKRKGERKSFNSPEGWVENLRYTAITKINILTAIASERKELWRGTDGVTIISYEILSQDLMENLIDDDLLNSYDLIILDEFQFEFESHFSLLRKISRLRNDFIWYVSTGSKEFLIKELQKILPEELDLSSLNISESSFPKGKSKIQDCWLRLENLQRVEYEEVLASAKKEMMEIVKEGNPFRFQSNIFTQIHKLKQACNFSLINKESSKANLLILQIQIIIASGRKIIISSQYDTLGIKMIEQVLKNNSISFITLKNNVSEIDYKKFTTGRNDVLIFSGRLSRFKISMEINPSIILFDNWWNPINNWHLENNLTSSASEKLEILSYQVRDTVDETIYNKLIEKNLLDKNLFDSLQADTYARLITDEDWLEVLDIQNFPLVSGKVAEKSKPLSQDYFLSLINQFLKKLGYENLNIEPGIRKKEFIMRGEFLGQFRKINITGFIFYEEFISANHIQDYLNELPKLKSVVDKIFVFTSGKADLNNLAGELISVVDGEKLLGYKKTFELI